MLEYLGVAVSVLLVVLSPLYSDKLVRLYARIGVFEPKIAVSATLANLYTDENYPEGFDLDSWSEEYRALSITLKNTGNSEIRNLTFWFQAPGGIKDVTVESVGAEGISVTPITDRVNIGPLERAKEDVLPASSSGRIYRVGKTGEVTLQFLIDTSQSEEAYMIETGVIDEEEEFPELTSRVFFNFNWEAHNVTLQAEGYAEIEDHEEFYQEFDLEDCNTISHSQSFDEVPRISIDVYDNPEDNPAYDYFKAKEKKAK